MAAVSELVLLLVSFGALSSWNQENRQQMVQDESSFESPDQLETTSEAKVESKSLYDLMQHFPLDKDISCPESDSRFRYPGECTRYVTCRDFKAFIRSCPPGMNFDQRYGHCRLAFEVDCDDDSTPAYECDTNEVYFTCGSSCERTCDSMHQMTECKPGCEEGCKCRMGYVRNRSGECVKPNACENANSLFSVVGGKFNA